jgi:ATP adenylyltransferase
MNNIDGGKIMSSCRLCGPDFSAEYWNEPLFESESFIVIASLGALVEGWLLLLPRAHYICVGALPASLMDEMTDIKLTAARFIRDVYGNVCAFEHGPHKENRTIGCGVDHAHLHLVPTSVDLRLAVSSFLPGEASWRTGTLADCRQAFHESRDYLYLEQPMANGSIATHHAFQGQLFRQAIASELGVLPQYNWRQFGHLKNVAATIARARTWNKNRRCPTKVKTAA